MNNQASDTGNGRSVRSGCRILVFIPMYNCAAQIPRVLAHFDDQEICERIGAILCVDNQSTDDTIEQARMALNASPVGEKYLSRNDDNYGLGGSHKVAIEFAMRHGFDFIIVLHGDDQGSICDILPYLADGEHHKCDALLGARFMSGSMLEGYSALRMAANHVFNWIFSVVAQDRLYDLGSGLNLFRTSIFTNGFHLRYADDLTFNYFLILGMAAHGVQYQFFPITWREDDQVSNAKLLGQGIKMLNLLRRRITNKDGFLRGEHRDTPRTDYPSTILQSWSAASTTDRYRQSEKDS